MSITVRRAIDVDAVDVATHQTRCVTECAGFRGDVPDPVPGSPSLVAVVDGCTVGSTSWTTEGRTVNLRHMWVDTDARGIGVGSALLRAVLDQARDSGATQFSCTVQPGNRSMKNLLERHGIVARSIRAGVDLA